MHASTTELASAMAAAWNGGAPARVLALAARATPAELDGEVVLLLLGMAQQASDLHAAARATFKQLVKRCPQVSAYWNNLALACRHAGDAAAAEQAWQRALELSPDDAELHYNLGLLHAQQRRWPAARDCLLEAAQRAPGFIDARLQAARACHACGDSTGQEAMLEGAEHWPAQIAEQALALASMLSTLGRPDAALRCLTDAMGDSADAGMPVRIAALRVLICERSNRLDEASEALQALPPEWLEALPADARQARAEGWRAHAAMAMRMDRHAAAEAASRRALAASEDHESRASAAFALAAACDRQGHHADAWQALGTAHAAQLQLAAEVVPELLAPDSQPLALAGEQVTRAAHARWHALPAPDAQHSPVFVVGFPRSGTTLLEQMLDAHPAFRSMDERAHVHQLIEAMALAGQHYPADLAELSRHDAEQLRRVYARLAARVLPDLGECRLVDKNPLNMLCLPMIMRLFPHARIILCLRHPCDVLLSCSMQPFRSPAFMVLCSSLQRLAQGYARAFTQWRHDVEVFAPNLLEWRYETVVDDVDAQLARLGRFLGVADTAPMARFAEHARAKRYISTPSYAQVTGTVHRGAVGRWQGYREAFEPVLPVLAPWIEALGYAA